MIHFVSGEYPPDIGGVGDYTAALRAALDRRSMASRVVTRRDVGGRWNARGLLRLLRQAPREGVLHIQFQAAGFDLLGDICLTPGLLRRVRPRVQTVTTFHDVRVPYLFARAGRLRARAVRLLARTSAAVIAADRRDLEWLGGPCHQFNVPIGPNIACAPAAGYARDGFRERIGLAPGDLAVVYFGLLNASKGLELLFEAFERVSLRHPRARLLLVGGEVGASDQTDQLTARDARLRLERLGGRALTTGWLPPAEVSAYLLAGDVALLPYADGASARRGSLLACAAHGLPIVSTQPAGVEVARFVRAVAPEADTLARAVVDASDDPSELQSASRALAEITSWPTIAERHIEIYSQLLHSTA